jgi:hypothetical protein
MGKFGTNNDLAPITNVNAKFPPGENCAITRTFGPVNYAMYTMNK